MQNSCLDMHQNEKNWASRASQLNYMHSELARSKASFRPLERIKDPFFQQSWAWTILDPRLLGWHNKSPTFRQDWYARPLLVRSSNILVSFTLTPSSDSSKSSMAFCTWGAMAQREATSKVEKKSLADIHFFHLHAFVVPHVPWQPKIVPLTPMHSSAAVLASLLKPTSSLITAAKKFWNYNPDCHLIECLSLCG